MTLLLGLGAVVDLRRRSFGLEAFDSATGR